MPDASGLADGILGFTPDPSDITTATAVIAELVRRISHCLTSKPAQALPAPQDVDRALWGMHATLQRLPDTLRHLADRAETIVGDTAIRSTGEHSPKAAGDIVAVNLREAAEMVAAAGFAVRVAASETSALYLDE